MPDIPTEYTMPFEATTIEHLSSKMYSRIGPAIAELVSNSWDADVNKVEINIADEKPYTISVRDYGDGMDPKQIQTDYLPIGRNCRKEIGTDETPNGRKIMGRKGLGKLSAFGVAKKLEMRTIHDGFAVAIELDYDKLIDWPKGETYKPDIIHEKCGKTKDKNGTEIILKDLKRKSQVQPEIIKKELAKKFSIITDDKFQVLVNGDLIKPEDRLRQQNCVSSYAVEDLPGGDIINAAADWKVSGWIGFLEKASSTDRGVDIFARGKAAELNSWFNLPSASDIVGRAYLVGEIHADFLDNEEGDNISTGRDSVQWTSLPGELLEKWGQNIIKTLLKERNIKVKKEKEEKILKIEGFKEWLDTRSPREQTVAKKLIKVVVDDETIESGSAGPLLEMVKSNIEFEAFQNLVDQIEESGGNIGMLMTLVNDWEIIEAREHLKLSDGRLEIIEQLNKYMEKGALEVKQMQPLFEKNGWLINPTWGKVSGQNRYSKLLRENCKEPRELDEKDRRIDILGYDAGGRIHIVELKRPEKTLSREDLEQIESYHDWAESNLISTGSDSPFDVTATLLVGKLSRDGGIKEKMKRLAGDNIRVETYDDIVSRARKIYGEVEEELKRIAPEYSRTERKKRKKRNV